MRDARRPTLVYGTRVRQGLRGRWFSLVPVDRAALVKIVAVLAAIVLAMVLMNDATVRFSSIESRPAFVSVFQIYRLGSLGRYVIGVLYLATAGAAWMVYQLRRFRNDDFRGNYRLWQWVVGVCLFASAATLVPILPMLGAAVEALMGQRIALSGHDWIGLFLVVGGAVLALRTIAEMSRYRVSLSMLIGGWFCAAIPVANQWNMITINTNLRWSIVTSAPLLAVTLWLIASVTYLRTLYCEVRGIEPSSGFLQRLRDSIPRPFAERETVRERDSQSTTERTPERRVARKPAPAKVSSPATTPVKATSVKSSASDGAASVEKNDEVDTPRGKRRWFGLLPPAKSDDGDSPAKQKPRTPPISKTSRRAAEVPEDDYHDEEYNEEYDDDSADDADHDIDVKSDTDQPSKPRRRWWPSLRGRSKPADDPDTSHADPEPTAKTNQPESSEAQPKKRRFGLGSIMKRKSVVETDERDGDDDRPGSSPQRNPSNATSKAAAKPEANSEADDEDDSDEEGFDDDGIDWSSMNKAERRRMRKQLKRGGKAA